MHLARRAANTPGSILSDRGYDLVTSVSEGESDKQAIVEFSATYGPYKTMFDRIIQASSVENCDDISADFATELPLSGREWMIESWSPQQSVLVPNPAYWGDRTPVTERVVMVPAARPGNRDRLAARRSGRLHLPAVHASRWLPPLARPERRARNRARW